MTTAVIVQARMGSTRLPGKVLKPLGKGTVLEEVLRRCKAIPGADTVCCAVPEGAESDPVASEAERCGASVVRGDESDVLDRYIRAARAVGATVVMRVTSDCPLIDPEVCGEVLALRAAQDADYASNNSPPSFPHGLDCEAFTVEALERAGETATEPGEREHVTPWLRNHPDVRRASLTGPGGALVQMRWTLDYPEDLAFFVALFEKLPPPPAIAGYRDIVAVLAKNPQIAAINAGRRDVGRTEFLGDFVREARQ